ncbi:hypothetical protein PENTCL1PPCAC_17302, partial [Pristionchus entomophagus]
QGFWLNPFESHLTKNMPFHGVAGDRDMLFMVDSHYYSDYSIHENLTVVSLTYQDRSFSLVIVMPEGDFGVWREKFTAEKFQVTIHNLKFGAISLELPKFTIDSSTNADPLKKLNVNRIFSFDADLSGVITVSLSYLR